MATQTLTSTSDEQTVKLSSEAVKVTEQINLSSPQETVEDDREKGKADNLCIPGSTLSTSEEKAVDIQVEPPVIEVKKTDETPVVDLPVHDNVKLEKESTVVAEVATAVADDIVHVESPSTEPVGGEATELPVIAFLEKTIRGFDATDNVKSPPEEQPTAEVIEREALEVPPAASAQKVEEQPLDAVGLPKSEDESSGDTVDSQEKEKPGAAAQSVTEVAEKVETVSVPVEEVEEKPKIIDNLGLSVVADSGKGPAEAEEEPATECINVEKEPDKEPETGVPEESVEPPKKEAQPIEVVPVEEPIEVVEKEIIEAVEPPAEKELPVEVHPIKGLEEVIAKEISEPIEVPKEKEQASEVGGGQESRGVIETKISESVEVPQESELLVKVQTAKEQVVIEKETNESIEPLKNKEQPDEVILEKESVEVIAKEFSASLEPPKNKEQADEGFSVTESGEVKEKETNDSTLGSKEVEKQEKEAIEVKNDIGELPEITKHVQDTYVEAETVKDEKPLAPGDDIGPPIEGKIQEEDGSDKQESVGQVAESGPIKDSDKGPEKEQPATGGASVEKEPKEEQDTTCVPEESVEPPKKEAQPIDVQEPVEMVAKEVIETIEPPTEKEQPVVIVKEISEVVAEEVTETVEPPTEKEQSVVIAKEIREVVAKETVEPPTEKVLPVVIAKEISEVVAKEVTETVEPPTEKEVIAKEIGEVVAKEVTETVEPPTEKEQPVVIAKEISEVVAKEVTETVEPPTEKVLPVVIAKEISEVVAEEVTETVGPPTEKKLPVVIAKATIESIEPLKNKEQPDEVISQKESVEVIAPEVSASFDPPPKNNKQADEGFPVTESGKRLEEEHPTKELVSVDNEPREEPETSPVPDLSIEPPKKEEQTIEVPTVEEQVEVITKEIIETIEPPTEKEQPIEVHPLKEPGEVTEREITEPTELPKEKEETDVHPVQESREVTTEKISETIEIPKENELLTEVHPVKEMEVIAEGTSESNEPPNNEQPDEVLFQKESLEVIAKEGSASFKPPKNKEHADEGFPVTESGEVKGKETSDSTLGSEEVVKQEPEIIEVEERVRELPELTTHVQDTCVEVENVKDKKALAPEDDINPPIEGGNTQEEEEKYAVESDKQVSVSQVAKSDLTEDSGKGLEKEQPAEEFVSVDKEPRKEPEPTCVPELSVEPPKKEEPEPPKKEEPVEILPAEQVEVIEKEIVEAVELPTEKKQPIGVHPLQGSEEMVEKEITEPIELPKEKEQATEVQPVQELKEVIAEKISESVEIPRESELLIEVQPVKELEVVAEDTSESIEPPKNKEQPNEVPPKKESEVIAKEISESFVPPQNTELADEGSPVTEFEEVRAIETSGSKLGPEAVEKRSIEVTEVKDSKEELPEITNQVLNDYVQVETEAIEKGESVKGEKSLALMDDSTPPLGVEQIHKAEKQCTVESDRQDSLGQGAQPSVDLAAGDFSPQDVKEDEKKESSNIDVVAKLLEVEAPAVEEKIVKTEKTDEDKYEKIQELTLPRDFETDAVVVEKSTDDQKAGEVVDLIAETKIEESIKDEQPAEVETGNAHVNETPKEPQESELEVKDKETVITGGEVPKVNEKKEVPSKTSHKHSHNLLSKVKQSLVKAKKAIIGKSPSSKTLSSEARDDIKVK